MFSHYRFPIMTIIDVITPPLNLSPLLVFAFTVAGVRDRWAKNALSGGKNTYGVNILRCWCALPRTFCPRLLHFYPTVAVRSLGMIIAQCTFNTLKKGFSGGVPPRTPPRGFMVGASPPFFSLPAYLLYMYAGLGVFLYFYLYG